MDKFNFRNLVLLIITICLTSCSSASHISAANPPAKNIAVSTWDKDPALTWEKLQHIGVTKLAAMQNTGQNPSINAWLELALISKRYSVDTAELSRKLIAWRAQYPLHQANSLFPDNMTLSQLSGGGPPRQIAILLPQRGKYAASGGIVREGFLNAYYANIYRVGNQSVKFYDTSQAQNMASLYQKAISEGADFVIGPLLKTNVQELSATNALSTPILALNYTEQLNGGLPSHFYEFGLSPEDEATQIIDRARKTGVKEAIVIAPQTPWGKRLVSGFKTRWEAAGGTIKDTWYYAQRNNFNQEIARLLNVDPNIDKQLMQDANDKQVLEQQRRQDFDVIFLFSQPQDARVIVPLLRYYYAGNIPIYANSAIYSGKSNPAKDNDLNGVTVCDIPWSKQAQLQESNAIQSDRLYAVGQDAYLLSQLMARLELLPNFPIYGTTGALTLSSQQIHRRVPCMTIRNGLL